jgi:FdhE protein
VTIEDWLAAHPYLQPLADVHARVDAEASRITLPEVHVPDWKVYADDFHAGVALLRSERAGIDVGHVEPAVLSLFENLSSIAALLHDPLSPAESGLARFAGWTMIARYLRPAVDAFDRWRDEERWLRNYCPTCGHGPAMAQLVGRDPGRLRMLACGCCRTRWRFRRTGCPFCDAQHDHRLAVLTVENQSGLRIDYCENCRGYLKTYDGEGSEAVLMADWTSLHLDVLARDRGLNRLATSLYDLGADQPTIVSVPVSSRAPTS